MRRPRRSPNFTLPSVMANNVSSPPRPTLWPGWKRVPRWRTMIAPAGMVVPSNTLTPSRWACESRPLRVEPPPLVLDMWLAPRSAGRRDGGDLDGAVVLAVPPAPALAGLRLVGHGPD